MTQFNVHSVYTAIEHSNMVKGVSQEQLSIAAVVVPETLMHYVIVPEASCFMRPVEAIDSVVAVLPYGTRVIVEEFQGRWARVSRGKEVAWVAKDTLTANRDDIFPVFENGYVYDAMHPVTTQTRALLNDEFHTANLYLPLQDIEYVTYRLSQYNFFIAWPSTRPRVAGRWRELLRGVPRVHIGVAPVAKGLMEYIDEEGHGHVVFVERAFADEGIEVSGVGETIEGRYERYRLAKSEWQQYRPVFIEIT